MDLHLALAAALSRRGLTQAQLLRVWGDAFPSAPADNTISAYLNGSRQPSAPRLRELAALLDGIDPLSEEEQRSILLAPVGEAA